MRIKQNLGDKLSARSGGSGATRPLRSNNTTDETFQYAVQTLNYIQSVSSMLRNRDSPIGLSINAPESRADADNIIKAIGDGLQGLLFENDAQIKNIHYQTIGYSENNEVSAYIS